MNASHLRKNAYLVIRIGMGLDASPEDTDEIVPTLCASVKRIERAEHLEVRSVCF
jgi:hypothetical protein